MTENLGKDKTEHPRLSSTLKICGRDGEVTVNLKHIQQTLFLRHLTMPSGINHRFKFFSALSLPLQGVNM